MDSSFSTKIFVESSKHGHRMQIHSLYLVCASKSDTLMCHNMHLKLSSGPTTSLHHGSALLNTRADCWLTVSSYVNPVTPFFNLFCTSAASAFGLPVQAACLTVSLATSLAGWLAASPLELRTLKSWNEPGNAGLPMRMTMPSCSARTGDCSISSACKLQFSSGGHGHPHR